MKTISTKIVTSVIISSIVAGCNSGSLNTSSSQSDITNKPQATKTVQNVKISSDNSLNLTKENHFQQNININGIVISNNNNHIYHTSFPTLIQQDLNEDGAIDEKENVIIEEVLHDEIKAAAISPDDNYITMVSDTKYIETYKKINHNEFRHIDSNEIKAIPTGVVISPDGRNAYISSEYHILFQSSIGYLYWYSINSDGTMSYKDKMELDDPQSAIAISPDNKFIYSTTSKGYINWYSIDNKDGSFKYINHHKQGGRLNSIAISRDKQYAFVGTENSNDINVYTINDDGSLNWYKEFAVDSNTVALTVSPNNKYLYIVDYKNKIHTYSITDNHCNNRPAPGVNWYGCNKSFQNLSNYNLSHANLTYANLHAVNLTNTNLSNTNLHNTNLSSAILDNTDLSGSQITKTDFNKTNFKNNKLNHTIINNSFFNEANLQNIDFTHAILNNNSFILANLENTKFNNLSLINTNFSQANLIKANFIKANLANSNFTSAALINTNFTEANLSGLKLGNGKECLANSISCCRLK